MECYFVFSLRELILFFSDLLRFVHVSQTEVAITANFTLYSETGKVELFAVFRLSGFAVVAKEDCGLV